MIGVSYSSARRLVIDGHLGAIRIRKTWRTSHWAIRKYLEDAARFEPPNDRSFQR